MRIRRLPANTILKPSKSSHACLTNTHSRPVLHLFRAILRECTYLPDPNSRKFFHDHVVARFRAYCPRPFADKRQSFKQTFTILGRRAELLKKAQMGIKYLRRANHGHTQHLGRVLAITYGRIGPRRHKLLKDLKNLDSPVSTSALKDTLQHQSDPANQHVPRPSQQLLTLLKSQVQRTETVFSRTSVKQIEYQIPKTNVWGRLTPIKRVRNIKRRWYAEALDRVMPPLPVSEWEMLRQKASGETSFRRAIPRRGPSGEQNAGLNSYKSGARMTRPHKLNARYMRRLWARIFQQCPVMKRDSHKPSGWHTIWPDLGSRITVSLDLDKPDDSGLFDGVNDDGKVLASAIG